MLNFINKFKAIDSSEVKGLDLYYLLAGNRKPENLLPIINYYNPNKNPRFTTRKHKDFSFLLQNSSINLDDFLLTKNMKGMPKDQVLQARKKLIKWHERNFVKDLGLTYDEPQFI